MFHHPISLVSPLWGGGGVGGGGKGIGIRIV